MQSIRKMAGQHYRWIVLSVLCIGGGVIYLLPYLRYAYYDSLIAAFDLTNAELGMLMTVYGTANIFSYILGGFLADRFQAKYLIAFSLFGSGVAGLYYATFPGYSGALMVHGIWSVTTVMTYWAAMIKAVKLLGDESIQGKLFGYRESGFAVFALAYSSLAILFFRTANDNGGVQGLSNVINIYSVVLIISGILSYLVIPRHEVVESQNRSLHSKAALQVLKMPDVWLAAAVIFCTYTIYSGSSLVIPYTTEIFGATVASAAFLGILRSYLSPILSAPIAGTIVDKIGLSTKYLKITFGIVFLLLLGLVSVPGDPRFLVVLIILIMSIALVLTSMRGIYWVLLTDLKLDAHCVGFATGLLSVVGFMPDAIMFTFYGNLLDNNPGEAGYQLVFFILILTALVGGACTLILNRRLTRRINGIESSP